MMLLLISFYFLLLIVKLVQIKECTTSKDALVSRLSAFSKRNVDKNSIFQATIKGSFQLQCILTNLSSHKLSFLMIPAVQQVKECCCFFP